LRNNAGRPSEALPFFERALEVRRRLAADYPTATVHQNELARLHMFIARDLVELGRQGEALEPLERAVALFERLVADHPGIASYTEDLAFTQVGIAEAHVGLGRPGEARRALGRARTLYEGLSTVSALYNLGCVESHLSDPALSDPAGGTGARGADREAHAERAIAALRRAVAAGFRNLDQMRTDPDLGPLRSRSDFQLLMMDLAFPSDPFAGGLDVDR
jgi:tetratricopeptide (TPR) repeat protein